MRESEYPGSFALVGAGSVTTSLAATFSQQPGALGPIVGVSYRVASRIANTLGVGEPARDASVLRNYPVILIHAPQTQMKALSDRLAHAAVCWSDKSLVFVDCEPAPMDRAPINAASFAWLRQCPMPGRLAVGGDPVALAAAIRLATSLDRQPIVVPSSLKSRFDAAMLLGGAALTPIIDIVAHILRETGMIDKQAARTAVALFESAVQAYSRSGRQSWPWHVQQPDLEAVEAQLKALGDIEGRITRSLLLLGFDRFQRHPAAAGKLRDRKRE
ncbi:MAG: hypothetical protein JWN34_1664 [Bryobacterales bacterium]|nr:hypothetical protein [Bryobacterales bacterium]